MASFYMGSSDEDSMSAASSLPNSPDSTCRLEIIEQPMEKVRFRYLSELQGMPHGPLLGERSTKSSKSFPRVKLEGYDGIESVKVRCWLVDKPPRSLGGEIRPHCHDLVVRKNVSKNEIVSEPHEISVSRDNNYTAVFENMVVLHCVQKNSETTYFNKQRKWKDRLLEVSSSDSTKFEKKKIRDTIKCINKNEVYLYFEAFMETRDSEHILCWKLSNAIKNLKNPMSGDLKIIKIVNSCGPVDGNTEIALFTEKVPPDVKVLFSDDSRQWKEVVQPETTHRYLAITIRSPRYPYDIDCGVKVKFCLYRESDGCESNCMEFTYLPSERPVLGKRKRCEISAEELETPSVGKRKRLFQYPGCRRFFEKVGKLSNGDSLLNDQIVLLPEELGLNPDKLTLSGDRSEQPSDDPAKQSADLADRPPDSPMDDPIDEKYDVLEQSDCKEDLVKRETNPISTIRVKRFEALPSHDLTKDPNSDLSTLLSVRLQDDLTDRSGYLSTRVTNERTQQSLSEPTKESLKDSLKLSSDLSEQVSTVQKLTSDQVVKESKLSDTNRPPSKMKVTKRIFIPVNRLSALSKCFRGNPDSNSKVRLSFKPVNSVKSCSNSKPVNSVKSCSDSKPVNSVKSCSDSKPVNSVKSCSDSVNSVMSVADSEESASNGSSQSKPYPLPLLKPMTTITYGSKPHTFLSDAKSKSSLVSADSTNGPKPSEKSPTKVFRVSKTKFQSYLKLMKQQGYIVKSVT